VSTVFYDKHGEAVAYTDDGHTIYLFSGDAVAYIDADAVYSFRGELLGWFENEWLRDRDGRCVAFTDNPSAGPQRPARRPKPEQALKNPRPVKDSRDPRILRPMHSNAWSAQSAQEFFSGSSRAWPRGLGSILPNRTPSKPK
jgi:hypothetical protein